MVLKIRSWVLLAAALILIPMVVVLMLALRDIDSDEKALIDGEVRYRVRELVYAVNERIAVSIQALQTLGNSEAARKGDWQALYQGAKRVVATNPYYVSATLVDRHDNLIFVTSVPFGEKTFGTSYIDLVHEVFKTGEPNVSGPFRVPISNYLLVAVSIPVMHDDRVTHVLRMVLRTDSFSELLANQRLPEGWIAALADQRGTLVARSAAADDFVGKPASATFRAAIERNDEKIYKGVTLEGVSNTSLALPVYGGDWFAAVAVPNVIIEQRYRWNMVLMGAACLLLVVLGITVALVLARFFADQASVLEQVVGSGRPDTPLPWALQILELKRVYQSYCDVSHREQRAQSDLRSVTLEKDEVLDLYEHAPCGYHSLDSEGRMVRINQTELDWLGKTRDQVLGQPYVHLLTAASQEKFREMFPTFLALGHAENLEFDLIRSDGSILPVSISATLLRDHSGQPLMSRSTVFDITERKKLERRLEELSNTDVLTGLWNRRHFYDVAAHELERNKRQALPLVVAMLDVDHFKQVNDRYGHAMGDQLLRALGATFKTALRQIDTVARFGGEEFVILMPYTNVDAAVGVLERLRELLQAARITSDAGESVGFTVSIGVTLLRPEDEDMDVTIARADAALYEAKRLGRNQVRVA